MYQLCHSRHLLLVSIILITLPIWTACGSTASQAPAPTAITPPTALPTTAPVDRKVQIVGKWRTINQRASEYTITSEYFADGTLVVAFVKDGKTTSNIGDYRFIDNDHIRVDRPESRSEVYEIISISQGKMVLKANDQTLEFERVE